MKNIIKNIIYSFLLVILVVFGVLYFTNNLTPVVSGVEHVLRPYPALSGAKDVTLTCDFHGKKLSVKETLYQSLDEYYKGEPNKRLSYYNNDNKGFVFNYEQDKTLDDLTSQIKALGAQNSLNSDQILDLSSCLMQSIPYDDVKAQKILSPNGKTYSFDELVPRYPYETLYDFSGICTDKSYLGTAIYKRLGYKTALLDFDKEQHLSVGISVPSGYGELGTNYAIMELTGTGFVVGDIPVITGNIGQTQNTVQNIPEISSNSQDISNTDKALSDPSRVESVSEGSDYQRIVLRTDLKKQIDTGLAQINSQKKVITAAQASLIQAENQLKSAENTYKSNPTTSSYQSYTSVYNSYTAVYNDTNSKIKIYNNLVKSYNNLIEEYKNF